MLGLRKQRRTMIMPPHDELAASLREIDARLRQIEIMLSAHLSKCAERCRMQAAVIGAAWAAIVALSAAAIRVMGGN
jgi:fructose-1,6-bisphosphatase/sedoheptulose 1,7-bisphosphatase-like protein